MVLRAVLLLCMVARRRVRCLGHVRPVVSPSVAKADMLHLGSELASCVEAGCAWLHFSIQDGIFVPKTSFGAPVVAAARRGVPDDVVLDVKLSCVEPENRVDEFAKAGADAISFHPEATKQPVAVLQRIRDAGVGRPASSAPRPLRRAPDGLPSPPAPAQVSPGVVLNPGTAVATVEELVDLADLAVVMLVSPGWCHRAARRLTRAVPIVLAARVRSHARVNHARVRRARAAAPRRRRRARWGSPPGCRVHPFDWQGAPARAPRAPAPSPSACASARTSASPAASGAAHRASAAHRAARTHSTPSAATSFSYLALTSKVNPSESPDTRSSAIRCPDSAANATRRRT